MVGEGGGEGRTVLGDSGGVEKKQDNTGSPRLQLLPNLSEDTDRLPQVIHPPNNKPLMGCCSGLEGPTLSVTRLKEGVHCKSGSPQHKEMTHTYHADREPRVNHAQEVERRDQVGPEEGGRGGGGTRLWERQAPSPATGSDFPTPPALPPG